MASQIVWQRAKNLVRFPPAGVTTGTADRNANVSCLRLVPAGASGVILTVECGYVQTPQKANAVELRIMPFGYDLNRVLDIHKHSALAGGGLPSVDVVAMQVIVPFHAYAEIPNTELQFFYSLQSTDSLATNKMMIIDVWGYTIEV